VDESESWEACTLTKNIKATIMEVTIPTVKMSAITVKIDGQLVKIPVESEIRAYFNEQFPRQNPSKIQRKRYVTLMNLMSAAYKHGKADAKK